MELQGSGTHDTVKHDLLSLDASLRTLGDYREKAIEQAERNLPRKSYEDYVWKHKRSLPHIGPVKTSVIRALEKVRHYQITFHHICTHTLSCHTIYRLLTQ